MTSVVRLVSLLRNHGYRASVHGPDLAEKVAFLREPASYPDVTGAVTAIETHFAWVFLAGRHAYKLKKPVRHHELDYRTLAAREWGCREELRLNRRLAPHVYQDVIPLSTSGRGRLMLGAGARVEDWLVEMQRLPPADMLDTALRRGAVTLEDVVRVIATLRNFYLHAAPAPLAPDAHIETLRAGMANNRAILESFGPRIDTTRVRAAIDAQAAFIERAGATLAQRGAYVVEGHGDLRAEHVYLGPPVSIIDCLEFNRDLRLLDPAEELALLLLEVERLDPSIADALRAHSDSLTPQAPGAGVMDFYMSHRATTRAKVAAWHLDDPQFPDAAPWIERAHEWLDAAIRHGARALDASAAARSRSENHD